MQTWPDTEKGQPPPPPAVHPTPRLVYNLRSVQADHSYYPDNTDEFVAELASELAATGGLAAEPAPVADPRVAEELAAEAQRPGGRWPLVHPVRLLEARARRRWRTSCRSNARNLLLVSGLLGAVAITLKLGGRGWDGLGADVGVGTPDQPGNAFGQLAPWAQEWLAKLPVVGGLADELPLQYLAGVLLAAAVVVVSALLLGRLWSVWDSNDVDRFFLRDRDRALGTWRTHWPSWAFLGLTGSLVLGIMAAVDIYTGRSGLIVALLAGALLFTATLVWVRWRTSLDETGADQQGIGEGDLEERGQGVDDLLDGAEASGSTRTSPQIGTKPATGAANSAAPRSGWVTQRTAVSGTTISRLTSCRIRGAAAGPALAARTLAWSWSAPAEPCEAATVAIGSPAMPLSFCSHVA
jgi:hypothetical protein